MAKVGTVEVDFKAGIANLISGVDQVNEKLGGVGKSLEGLGHIAETAEAGFSFLSKFAMGGAAAAGVGALVNHLYHLAEAMSDVNPAAKQFTYEIDSLRAKVAESIAPAFEKLNPFLHTLNDLLEHGGDLWANWAKKADDALKTLGNNPVLAALMHLGESVMSGGLFGVIAGGITGRSGESFSTVMNNALLGGTPIGQTTREMAQEGIGQKKPAWMEGWDAEWARELKVYQQFQEQMEDIDKDAAEKKFNRSQDMFWNQLQDDKAEHELRLKQEDERRAATSKSFKSADDLVLKQHKDMWEAAAKQADDFGAIIASGFVDAQEQGFKAVLAGWTRTLEQMLIKALATDFFGAMFGEKGLGGGTGILGGFLKGLFSGSSSGFVPGFVDSSGVSGFTGAGIDAFLGSFTGAASGADFIVPGTGGPDSRIMRVSPGERVKVFPPAYAAMDASGNGVHVTVVNNNTFNGNMDRTDYLRLLEASRQQTLADVRSQQQRRW